MKRKNRKKEELVLLNDLAPRKDIKGGAGKRVFGERAQETGQPTAPQAKRPGAKSKTKT
jgi:hypothetical protein